MQSILVLKLMTHTNAYTAYKQPGFITMVFLNMFIIYVLCVISGRSDIGSSFQHHILMVKSTKLFSYDKYNSLLQADKRIPQP